MHVERQDEDQSDLVTMLERRLERISEYLAKVP